MRIRQRDGGYSDGMETVTLRLGDLSFHLRPGVSVRSLEKKLVAAAKAGAGVVKLPLSDDGEVDAVVTAAVPVVVERHRLETRAADREQHEPPVSWSEFDLPEFDLPE